MVTLKSSCKPSGCLSGPNANFQGTPDPLDAGQESVHGEVIITGSFNGLMDRVTEVDFFDVWCEFTKAKKVAKKQKKTPTVKISQVLQMTGLTREDLELFITDIPLIEVVEPGADPVLSFSEVYCLVKIFERIVDDRVI